MRHFYVFFLPTKSLKSTTHLTLATCVLCGPVIFQVLNSPLRLAVSELDRAVLDQCSSTPGVHWNHRGAWKTQMPGSHPQRFWCNWSGVVQAGFRFFNHPSPAGGSNLRPSLRTYSSVMSSLTNQVENCSHCLLEKVLWVSWNENHWK